MRLANLQNAPPVSGTQTVDPNGSYTAGDYLDATTVWDNDIQDFLNGTSEGQVQALDWFFANLGSDDNRDHIAGLL